MNEVTTDCHAVASRFIGTREVAGTLHNPQIMAMLRLDNEWPTGDEVPWCSAFVNYVAWILGVTRSKSLAARSWATIGQPVNLQDAARGMDVVVLSRGASPASGHVGFFHLAANGSVWLLGGNQGDAVSISEFKADRIVAVRRLSVVRKLAGSVGE